MISQSLQTLLSLPFGKSILRTDRIFLSFSLEFALLLLFARLYNQPFEMVGGTRRGQYYTGAVDCAGRILKTEGILAFWKGFTGHFMRTGPQYVAAFTIMGWMERMLHSYRVAQGKTAFSAE